MGEKPSILIVDDEKRMCESLKVLLDNEGYNNEIADSGQKAMDILSNGHVDVILLDGDGTGCGWGGVVWGSDGRGYDRWLVSRCSRRLGTAVAVRASCRTTVSHK